MFSGAQRAGPLDDVLGERLRDPPSVAATGDERPFACRSPRLKEPQILGQLPVVRDVRSAVRLQRPIATTKIRGGLPKAVGRLLCGGAPCRFESPASNKTDGFQQHEHVTKVVEDLDRAFRNGVDHRAQLARLGEVDRRFGPANEQIQPLWVQIRLVVTPAASMREVDPGERNEGVFEIPFDLSAVERLHQRRHSSNRAERGPGINVTPAMAGGAIQCPVLLSAAPCARRGGEARAARGGPRWRTLGSAAEASRGCARSSDAATLLQIADRQRRSDVHNVALGSLRRVVVRIEECLSVGRRKTARARASRPTQEPELLMRRSAWNCAGLTNLEECAARVEGT